MPEENVKPDTSSLLDNLTKEFRAGVQPDVIMEQEDKATPITLVELEKETEPAVGGETEVVAGDEPDLLSPEEPTADDGWPDFLSVAPTPPQPTYQPQMGAPNPQELQQLFSQLLTAEEAEKFAENPGGVLALAMTRYHIYTNNQIEARFQAVEQANEIKDAFYGKYPELKRHRTVVQNLFNQVVQRMPGQPVTKILDMTARVAKKQLNIADTRSDPKRSREQRRSTKTTPSGGTVRQPAPQKGGQQDLIGSMVNMGR